MSVAAGGWHTCGLTAQSPAGAQECSLTDSLPKVSSSLLMLASNGRVRSVPTCPSLAGREEHGRTRDNISYLSPGGAPR